MADELEKRWNKSYGSSKMKFENDRKLLHSMQQRQSLKVAEKRAEDATVPYTEWIFCILTAARIYAALTCHITDCDETYNFWEPSHFLAFRSGFQTWEYNPKFALRSYFYVGFHAALAKISSLFFSHKVFVFYFVRMMLGMFCAVSEDQFYSAIYKKFGSFIANCWLITTVFAPGMFISSASYLPSSFAMCCITLAYAAWLDGCHQTSVLWVAAASIIGWPFAAVLGIPIFWDIVIKNGQFRKFCEYFLVAFMYTISPLVLVDLMLYRRVVVAPLNIILYNVFNIHGSSLYGTEPLSFYFYNGFLNFNVAFGLALLALPSFLLYRYFSNEMKWKVCYLLVPMYIWFGIMFSAPHKEERFLYPVYPLISFSASVVLYILWKSTSACFGYFYKHMKEASILNISGFFIIYIALSCCRISALETYYRAPMHLYKDVYNIPEPSATICVGKEWHRFPSSFFVPNGATVRFVKSEFKGQLPQRYYSDLNGTYGINPNQNDKNKEEPSVYVSIK